MHMREDFPIMPLNMVLFPGAPSTIYVHEQRYRDMLEECLNDDRFFGVALLKAGREVGGPAIPYEIGTVAYIAEVTQLPDGSSVVLVRGGPRFRIDAILSVTPVLRADVEILADSSHVDPEDEPVIVRAREQLQKLMRLVMSMMGGKDLEPDVPSDPVQLSYAIAANLQTNFSVLQRMLETNSPAGRLKMALPLLEREVAHYRVLVAAHDRLESLGLVVDNEEGPFSRN